MKRTPTPVLWLPVIVGIASAAQAAAARVELSAGSRQAFVGEALSLEITIHDFSSAEPPVFPDIPDATVRQLGGASESSHVQIFNGVRSESHTRTYQYELVPTRVGDLTIPPVPVTVDGGTLYTRELTIRVKPSDADDVFWAEISAGRNRLYVGQKVRVKLTIWVKPVRYRGQILDARTVLRELVKAIDFGPFPLQARVGQAVPPGHDPSERYYTYDFVTEFIADRPGPLSFDEVELGLVYPTDSGYRKLRTRPRVEAMQVLPVPAEGRPPGFNGAVGLFDIDVSASPTSVSVGDPIELTVDVFGDGPVETLPPPLLSDDQKLSDNFRLPSEKPAGEMHDGRRRYKFTLRATSEEVTEVPAIEYPYFDPDAERFYVARSDPIPLNVAPVTEVRLPDVSSPDARTALDAPQVHQLDGLRDIKMAPELLLTSAPPVTLRLVATVTLLPPAVFLAAWLGSAALRRRAADSAGRRRQAAFRSARRRILEADTLPDGEAAGAIAGAMSSYLSDRLNEAPARFSGSAAVALLRDRGVPAQTIDEWETVLRRCEEASFGGFTSADASALATQALACLTALERQRL